MRGFVLCCVCAGLLAASLLSGCAQEKKMPEPGPSPTPTEMDLATMPKPPTPPVLKQPELPYPRGGRWKLPKVSKAR